MISIGTLIDQSWDSYRSNFGKLMEISAWLLLIPVVKAIGLILYPDAYALVDVAGLSATETIGVLIFAFSNYVLTPIIGLLVLGTTVLFITGGKNRALKPLILKSKQLLIPAIYISILLIAVLIAAILIGVAPSLILALIASFLGSGGLIILSNILLILGIIVAAALTVMWSLQFIFAPYVLFLETTKGMKALLRSQQLVKGRFWQVFLRIVLPKVLFLAVALILLTLATNLFLLLMQATPAMAPTIQAKILSIANSTLPILVAMLINPLIILADVLLFKELAR